MFIGSRAQECRRIVCCCISFEKKNNFPSKIQSIWAHWVSPYDTLQNRYVDTYGPTCKSGRRNPDGNWYLGPIRGLERPKMILFGSRAQEYRWIASLCISSERTQFSKQNSAFRSLVVLIVFQVVPIKNLDPMGEPIRFGSELACRHTWA